MAHIASSKVVSPIATQPNLAVLTVLTIDCTQHLLYSPPTILSADFTYHPLYLWTVRPPNGGFQRVAHIQGTGGGFFACGGSPAAAAHPYACRHCMRVCLRGRMLRDGTCKQKNEFIPTEKSNTSPSKSAPTEQTHTNQHESLPTFCLKFTFQATRGGGSCWTGYIA